MLTAINPTFEAAPSLVAAATHFPRDAATGRASDSAAPRDKVLERDAAGKPLALVVDDAPDVTEMLGMLMRLAGYEVVTAYGAAEAFEAARQSRFDVVISDIGMPGMNGYELAEALRRLPAYQSVPLVAVTGFSMYDDRERALVSGFDGFLTKPINPSDLIATVNRLRE